MLFYPRRPNRVWQGLVPSRRETIVNSIVSGISSNLFSPQIISTYIKESGFSSRFIETIQNMVSDPEFRAELRELLKLRFHELLSQAEVQDSFRSILNELIDQWKAETLLEVPIELSKRAWAPLVVEKIIGLLPQLPHASNIFWIDLENRLIDFSANLTSQNEMLESELIHFLEAGFQVIHIEEIIRSQLLKMDEAQLEQLLTGNVSTELIFLQTSGGLLGLVVGLAINFPWLCGYLLLLGVILWIIYRQPLPRNSPE